MTGVLLGAMFSRGCRRSQELGKDEVLADYVAGDESHTEKEIRDILKQYHSYLYYLVIARANGIEDPFDEQVVRAHWIGNSLLDTVKPDHVKLVFGELKDMGWGEGALRDALLYLSPVTTGKGAHHNTYVVHASVPECRVELYEDGFYHLRTWRMEATGEDRKNFEEYSPLN